MKLALAIAIAKQQIDPNFHGTKWVYPCPNPHGFYRARNGQWMTGTAAPNRSIYTPKEFLKLYDK